MKLITATILALAILGVTSLRPSQAQVTSNQGSQTIRIARSGTQPLQKGATDRFNGSVRIDPLFGAKYPSRTSGGSVTFEPGARRGVGRTISGQRSLPRALSGALGRDQTD
jgi:hypothetical protein